MNQKRDKIIGKLNNNNESFISTPNTFIIANQKENI